MATSTDYLNQLISEKNALAVNLTAKGVTASSSETFTTLVPKVLDIDSGSGIIVGLTAGTSSNPGILSAIKKIPASATVNGTDLQYAFANCVNLEEVEVFDTSNVTNFLNTFYGCSSLTTIPLLNTSNANSVAAMFNLCSALTTIPQLDISNATSVATMFSDCSSLTTIPLLDTSKVTNAALMFLRCTSLTTLGGLKDFGKAFLTTQAANYSSYKLDLSVSTNITHDSLMNVINNLYNIASKGVATQQLVLGSTNMAKLTSSEIAIATNKGWTVS